MDNKMAITNETASLTIKSDAEKDILRKRRISLIKLVSIGVLFGILVLRLSLSWFTQNREVENTGLGAKSTSSPFEIKTRSNDGVYKSIYEDFQEDAVIWQVTSGHNFDNDLAAKKEEETEPGLEPGDSGSLEFCIKPKEDNSITLDCVFEIRAFAYVKNSVTNEQELQEVSSSSSYVNFLSSHIMLFESYDSTTEKYSGLIGNDNSLRRVIENKTFNKTATDEYVTIYWVWPEHLSDLTDKSKAIYKISDNAVGEEENESGYLAVIDYIAANKDGFFKDCTEDSQKVKTDLTELGSTNSSQIYNRYNIKYDNADLEIGNNVNYVIISMTADSSS